MRRYILSTCLCLLFISAQAQAIVHVSQGYLDTLYHKYPVHSFVHAEFSNSFEWDTPYFNTGGQFHAYAYWFPSDLTGAGRNNYENFEIVYSSANPAKLGLGQRLGRDPGSILH